MTPFNATQKNKGGRDRDVPEVVGRLRAGVAQLFVCFGGVEDTSKERRLVNCYFTSLIKQAFNTAFESQFIDKVNDRDLVVRTELVPARTEFPPG